MKRMLMPRTLRAWQLLTACVAMLMLATTAQAHLMVAQKGTLNLSGSGGFLLLSLPISGLHDVDDNADGLLSAAELQHHSASIIAQLKAGVQLLDDAEPCPLEGLMLHLSPSDDQEGQPANQIIAMGRFALPADDKTLSLRVSLWGTTSAEQSLAITLTKELKAAELLMLTPAHPQAQLYPSTPNLVLAFTQLGIAAVATVVLLVLRAVLAAPRFRLLHTVMRLTAVSIGLGWIVQRLFFV